MTSDVVVIAAMILIAIFSEFAAKSSGETAAVSSGERAAGDNDYQYSYEAEYDSALGRDPAMDSLSASVVARVNDSVLLPCTIDYLGKYKVAWLDNKSIPLTYVEKAVIDDKRFRIIRPVIKTWHLRIEEVKVEDAGQYRCTVNTKPVMSKIISLLVTIPPTILGAPSSPHHGDPPLEDGQTVLEGSDVTFHCSATGIPRPKITWYRRTNHVRLAQSEELQRRRAECGLTTTFVEPPTASLNGRLEQRSVLTLYNVSRFCDDLFECVADNGVDPPAVKLMSSNVVFRPNVTLPNRRISQSRGRQTILECIVTASPRATVNWVKDKVIVGQSERHDLDMYDEEGQAATTTTTFTSSLRIRDLEDRDYGSYACVASNSVGQTELSMELVELLTSISALRLVKSSRSSTTPNYLMTSSKPRRDDTLYHRKSAGNRAVGREVILNATWLHYRPINDESDGHMRRDDGIELISVKNKLATDTYGYPVSSRVMYNGCSSMDTTTANTIIKYLLHTMCLIKFLHILMWTIKTKPSHNYCKT